MVNINETTTIYLPIEEQWRQATAEENDLEYINNILSGPEETPVESKELIKKGHVKPFHQRHLEFHNGLIFYHDTPHTARVRRLSLRVVPVKFRKVVMSACHVYSLALHSHEQRTLLIILA